jgi:DNA modification methylase
MNTIEFGDCRNTMRRWASEGIKAQMCVTSPPYFGLRDYGHEGQIGLEQTPEQYIAAMVEVFRCVRDVLADDGTLWLNIGDSYGNGKQLLGVPWRLALALQSGGWILRQDIIWHKPNPMPESVRDRCTKAHEYIFLLSKSQKYFFDADSIRVPNKRLWDSSNGGNLADIGHKKNGRLQTKQTHPKGYPLPNPLGANRRSVWSVATRPYKGAHFATFPPDLIEPCILAGSKVGDVVLDPFMGSGTTAEVSLQHKRGYLGCEINEAYGPLQQKRIHQQKERL